MNVIKFNGCTQLHIPSHYCTDVSNKPLRRIKPKNSDTVILLQTKLQQHITQSTLTINYAISTNRFNIYRVGQKNAPTPIY